MFVSIQHQFWSFWSRCFVLTLYVLHSFGSGTATYSSTCPEWTGQGPTKRFTSEDGTVCYVHVQIDVTWYTAHALCSKNGWSLIKIPSPHTNLFFLDYILKQKAVGDSAFCFWIGLSDLQSEGDFRWTDGSRMTFGEVEVALGPFQWIFDCVMMCRKAVSNGSVWSETSCSGFLQEWNFICEADSTARTTISKTENSKPPISQPKTDYVRRTCNAMSPSKPNLSFRSPLMLCLRECHRRKCVMFNFHPAANTCNVYLSPEVLTEDSEHVEGWEVWVELKR